MNRFARRLKQLEAISRCRTMRPAGGIDFTSNDYLQLSTHPALRQVMRDWAAQDNPAGATGSRLLRGHHPAHAELENFAAQFFGAAKALYFATGFQANHALFSTLPERGDVIVYDALIHASVRDGIQGSAAAAFKFRHNDLEDCENVLRRARAQTDQIFLAVESVYSMDGDRAPLPELLALAARYDAWLIVDEAHATGIFGPTGRGLTEGFPHDHLVTLHTGGKALGVAGGLICAAAEIIDYLVNRARPFIYSTAPLPLQAALLQRAMQLIDEEPERRMQLLALRDVANVVLPIPSSSTQIMPVIIGGDAAAMAAAASLQDAGFDVRAIRPPTVPEGTARLRLSLNIGIDPEMLARLGLILKTLPKSWQHD